MLGLFGKKEEPYVSILAGTEDEPDDFEGNELLVSAVSDVGFVREGNEDSFYADGFGVKPEENCLLSRTVGGHVRYIFAVCDGMGGEAYGELASKIAAQSLSKRSEILRNVERNRLRKRRKCGHMPHGGAEKMRQERLYARYGMHRRRHGLQL